MADDTKQMIIFTLAVTLVVLAFVNRCTAVVSHGSDNRVKLACIERGKNWSEGNCS